MGSSVGQTTWVPIYVVATYFFYGCLLLNSYGMWDDVEHK